MTPTMHERPDEQDQQVKTRLESEMGPDEADQVTVGSEEVFADRVDDFLDAMLGMWTGAWDACLADVRERLLGVRRTHVGGGVQVVLWTDVLDVVASGSGPVAPQEARGFSQSRSEGQGDTGTPSGAGEAVRDAQADPRGCRCGGCGCCA